MKNNKQKFCDNCVAIADDYIKSTQKIEEANNLLDTALFIIFQNTIGTTSIMIEEVKNIKRKKGVKDEGRYSS